MSFPNSRQLVLNLANRDNPPPNGVPSPNFTDVTFDPVVVLENAHSSGREVSVLIRSLTTGRFRNNRIVYYDRYDLTTFFGAFDEVPYVQSATAELMLDAINARYGLSLSIDEFTITEFEEDTYDGTQITLVAIPGNYAYRGSKVFTVVNEGLIPLETVIVNQILNGLVYPEVEILPLTEDDNYELSGDLIEGDGDLLGGFDLSAEGFMMADNEQIRLAVSVAPLGSDVLVPLTNDGEYYGKRLTIPAPDSDWNIIVAAQLIGEYSSQKITDHYDVELTVTNSTTNESLEMILIDSVINAGTLDWRIIFDGLAHPNGNDITDNGLSVSNDTILSVHRLSYYRETVMPGSSFLGTPPRALVGQFVVTMRAYRKDSVAQPVVVTLNVNVDPPIE